MPLLPKDRSWQEWHHSISALDICHFKTKNNFRADCNCPSQQLHFRSEGRSLELSLFLRVLSMKCQLGFVVLRLTFYNCYQIIVKYTNILLIMTQGKKKPPKNLILISKIWQQPKKVERKNLKENPSNLPAIHPKGWMEFLRMAMAMICNNSSTFNLPSKISSNHRCISSNNQDSSLLIISNSNFISNK